MTDNSNLDTGTWMRKMKEKKDWSLKGQHEALIDEKDEYFYSSEQIEILRQKIIKDIQSIPNDVMHPSRKLMAGRIVNKRFGVDE
jgi:hypothetical protein